MPATNSSADGTYVADPQTLEGVLPALRSQSWLAVDTEFVREETYFPRLGLIQLANDQLIACIDPIQLPDLEPVLELVFDETITKVLHAAHQDLELFYHLRGAVPAPVYDTQIAGALLGMGEQSSYARMVWDLLGETIDKAHTRTDWTRRPLSSAQIRYAADDVRFLRDIYRRQLEALEASGRLDWLEQDFEALRSEARYRPQLRSAWLRVRGVQYLSGGERCVLRELADWRERAAIAADRPRRWIMGDDVLLAVARHQPGNTAELRGIRELPERLAERYGDALLEAVSRGRQVPEARWPAPPRPSRASPEEAALVRAVMEAVRGAAAEHDLSPQTLATRKEIERLAGGDQDIPLMRGWRRRLAGERVLALVGSSPRPAGSDS